MTPEIIRTQTSAVISSLTELAKRLPEDTFSAPPSGGGWTLGQIYDHLIRSCVDLHLPYAESCLRGEGKPGRKRFSVALLFLMGGFPKTRVNPNRKVKEAMPNGWEPKTLSRTETLEGLQVVAQRMDKICSSLSQSNPKIKICYPPMGYLNASEWAQMVPMHLKHHLEVQIAKRHY
jgi:hypothetical protein